MAMRADNLRARLLNNVVNPMNYVLGLLENPTRKALLRLPLRLIPFLSRNQKPTSCVGFTFFSYRTPGLFNGNEVRTLRAQIQALDAEIVGLSAVEKTERLLALLRRTIAEDAYHEGGFGIPPVDDNYNSTFSRFLWTIIHELERGLNYGFERQTHYGFQYRQFDDA